MRKLFAILMFAWAASAHADNMNNVWLPFTGGTFEAICRMVWNDYDRYFGTSTVLHIKQGASGEVAIRDMLDSREQNRVMCAGATMIIYNQYLFQDTKTLGDNLQMLIRVANLPSVWYVPNSTPSLRTLDDLVVYLRSLKRPINVGIFQGATRSTLQVLTRAYNLEINLVMFKNGPQMYPSLVDGSLDLAIDAGGGVRVAEEGRFKIIGHVSSSAISQLRSYPNFAKSSKELADIESWIGIAVPKHADPQMQRKLTTRLGFVISQQSFQSAADEVITSADGLHGPRLDRVIQNQKNTVKKYWQ